MEVLIGFTVLAVLVIVWTVLSIKSISPTEMGVLVLFSRAVKYVDSGFHFVPLLPGCKLVRFPKKTYNLDYQAREVVSTEDKYQERNYGAQVLKVSSVAYLSFPRDKDLIKILEAGIPIDEDKLRDWTEESVVGALRVALGNTTWKEATENVAEIRRKADDTFRTPDGSLLRVGFNRSDIKLTIKEIQIPDALKKDLTEVDKQRLEAEAAPFEAIQRAEETIGAVIDSFTTLSGMSRKEVQEELKKDSEEFIKKNKALWDSALDIIHRRMAIDGKSFLDIRTPDGSSVESLIALFKILPLGGLGGGSVSSGTSSSKSGRSAKKPKTDEERIQANLKRLDAMKAGILEKEEEEEGEKE